MSVDELADALRVGPSTVGRDLHRLERDGALGRVQEGAAASVGPAQLETRRPSHHREVDRSLDQLTMGNRADKETVAAAAAQLVSDGDSVTLDIGTTTALLARRLRRRRITVLAFSLAVVGPTAPRARHRADQLGGVLRRRYHCLAGSLTQDALRQVRARWAFLGTSEVAPDGGFLNTTLDEVPVRRAMIRVTDGVVVLAAHNKLPSAATLRVCDGGAVHSLITNKGRTPPCSTACRAQGMQVVIG